MQHTNLVLAFSFASLITVPAMSMEDPGKKHPQKFSLQEIPLQEIETQELSLNTTPPQLPLATIELPPSSPSITIPKPRFNDSSSDDSSSEDFSPKNTPSIPRNLLSKSSLKKGIKTPPEDDIFTLEFSDED
jgi:hypothetical protein